MLLNVSLIDLFLVDQLYNTHNHGAQIFFLMWSVQVIDML